MSFLKKLARPFGMFSKAKHFLPMNVLIINYLYTSLFLPYLQYGILVWGLKYGSYINPVFLLQKRVTRAITFENSASHSTPIFSVIKIFRLYDLFQPKRLTFIYQSVIEISPACFHNFFNLWHLLTNLVRATKDQSVGMTPLLT